MDVSEVNSEETANAVSNTVLNDIILKIGCNDDPLITENLSAACQNNVTTLINSEIETPDSIMDDSEIISVREKVLSELPSDEGNDTKNEELVLQSTNTEQNNVLSTKNICEQNRDKQITTNNDVPCIIFENDSTLQAEEDKRISSLSAIAAIYGNSDSDTEDTCSDFNKRGEDKPIIDENKQTYRSTIEVSSSETSDSEDDSSSSSDITESSSDSSDSDSDKSTKKTNKDNNKKERKNNEITNELDILPPIEDLKITVPEVLCDPLGEVAWMVEQLVVVQPKAGKPTLNLDTVLFIEKGQRALGKIFDVFGQVSEPYYCVRFNSSEHIKECDIKVGMTVYYCPNTQYTSLVFLHELTKIKGTDAVGDDEPPEFSDDEEERAYYEKLKQKQINNANNSEVPSKRKRASSPATGWQSNHPWNRNSQRNRRGGQYTRRDNRTFNPSQSEYQQPNVWGQFPYQSGWPSVPRYMHPAASEQYGYGSYSPEFETMQYTNPNVNNGDQAFQEPPQHSYYGDESMTVPMSPRMPYNARPRFSPGFPPFGQNRPNSGPNMRFRNPDPSWQPRLPQMPRMHAPWVSLPPPPPPPPPPPSSGTS